MEGAEFHPLEVADIERLTDDAVAVTFAVPAELVDRFRYLPGQHVTVRANIDGEDVRRSYSICADATTGTLRVGIKRLPGGTFSTWANESLEMGQELGVATPVGEFTIETVRNGGRHYGAVAAGSGITPVLSLISTALAVEPQSRFTLLYGNQESRTIMFLEELEGLKDRYPDRFHLIHVLSREDAVVPLFSGRLDRDKLEHLLDAVVDDTAVDDWYLCGPHEMVETARALLTDRGFDPDAIHDELFFSGPPLELSPDAGDDLDLALVRFTLEGRTSQVRVPMAGAPVLDYALTVRRELPFSCRGGMCTSCRARVVAGEVRLDKNWSLTTEELEGGQVLTCQAHPVTDDVELTYDL